MNELEKLWSGIENVVHGTVRAEMLKSAIGEADRMGDYSYQMKFRLELMDECCFYEDDLQVLLLMPEVLRLYDEHIKQGADDTYLYDIIWNYKWVLSTAINYYQVSKEQFEAMSEDFKKRCLENGYSLRPYHMIKAQFYKYIDKEIEDKEFQMFLKSPSDSMSNCKACEKATEVEYYLVTNQIKKAEKSAKNILNGTLSCTNLPWSTYTDFITFDIEKICSGARTVRDADEENEEDAQNTEDVRVNRKESGIFNQNGVVNLDEMERYCDLVRKAIYDKGILEQNIGEVIMGYVLCNKKKALNMFKKNYDCLERLHSPDAYFDFSIAAVNLFKQIDETKPYHMKINKKFVLYQESDTYDVKKLIEYYDNIARSIAQKFDERNGTDYFMRKYRLRTSYEEIQQKGK